MRERLACKGYILCQDVRVLGIESVIRYFLGIVGILEFCDFVIFISCCSTWIL